VREAFCPTRSAFRQAVTGGLPGTGVAALVCVRILRHLIPAIGAALFCASIVIVARELERVGFAGLTGALRAMPIGALGAAVALTIVNYAILTMQDQLAVSYAAVAVPRRQVALASFIAYAVSNSVGFAMLSGTTARYRFYSRWNLTPGDLSRIVLFYSVSFWIGLAIVAGTSLIFSAPSSLGHVLPSAASGAIGGALLSVVGTYAALCVRGGTVRVWRLTLRLPSPALMTAQTVVSVVDWLLAGAVLYVLLPPASRPGFLPFAGLFAAAQLVGLASHVPGGVGVFDGLMVLLLKNQVASVALLPALVAID
jgi:phosphatidylglycerol lysyltransferase